MNTQDKPKYISPNSRMLVDKIERLEKEIKELKHKLNEQHRTRGVSHEGPW